MSFTDADLLAAQDFLPSTPRLTPVADAMTADPEPSGSPSLPSGYTEDELLSLVRNERQRSVGLDNDDELAADREKALNYFKGEMPDVPALPNRSKAVSTDVADAVETLLPDLIDIFTGGEDVATFQPEGPEDEEAAEQETDYVNHVVFQENAGFMVLYAAMKDALLLKTGVLKAWWEAEPDDIREERFTGKNAAELQMAEMAAAETGAEVVGLSLSSSYGAEPLYDFAVRQTRRRGKVCISAVPPDDFTVAANTVSLRDTHYCAMRSRPLALDLIADGYDRDLVEMLPAYGSASDDSTQLARDTAGEHDDSNDRGGIGDHRTVEVVEHYIRLLNDRDEPELWKVITGGVETVLLDAEQVESIPFSALTPYPVAHRFYGRSVADLLMELQRIRTALTRMALDSGYFALNQRNEVAMNDANEFTISDLLRNEPGVPVRSKTGSAVRPISAGQLGFDAFGALEYFATVSEQRTGIIRNAQGLKPDTMHETASGAIALMTNAQRRIRLIARIFAETGIKDLFLHVHDLVRRNPTSGSKKRLRGKWVDVDPTSWGARSDMDVLVGLGSGGAEHDMQVSMMVLNLQKELIAGGKAGFVSDTNLWNALKLALKGGRVRGAENYFTAPPPADPNAPPPESPPDPDAIAAQGKAQADVITAQTKAQKEQAETVAALQRAEAELQFKQTQNSRQREMDHEQALARIAADERVQIERIAREISLKERQLAEELALKERQLTAEAQLKLQIARLSTDMGVPAPPTADIGDVPLGGDPG